MPEGMPPLHAIPHGLPYEASAVIAAQETNAACTVATLAAVDEGLGRPARCGRSGTNHAVSYPNIRLSAASSSSRPGSGAGA